MLIDKDVSELALSLLEARAVGATVCPSEVARAMIHADGSGPSADDWRSAMPAVHAAVDGLVAEGKVQLSWKGKKLVTRAGPYRIGRGPNVELPDD